MNRQIILAGLSLLFTGAFLASGVYQVITYTQEPMSWVWLVGSAVAFGLNSFHVWKRW